MADISEIIEFATNNLRAIEYSKNVVFSSFAKAFFELALIESLSKTNLSLYTNDRVNSELVKTFTVIIRTIDGFQVTRPDQRRVITIEDLMGIIHLRWCGVYPFFKSLG